MASAAGTSLRTVALRGASTDGHRDEAVTAAGGPGAYGAAPERRIGLAAVAGVAAAMALWIVVGRLPSGFGLADLADASSPVSGEAQPAAAGSPLGYGDSSAGGVGARDDDMRGRAMLLSDAEFVYGPLVGDFDAAELLPRLGGPVAERAEFFRGRERSAGEILQLVALEHSVSPRLLLALLYSGGPDDVVAATGMPADASFAASVESAAAWLSDGYYGMKYRDETEVFFADGSSAPGPVDAGAAHFAVARYLALDSRPDEEWLERLDRFAATYGRLFGPLAAASAAGTARDDAAAEDGSLAAAGLDGAVAMADRPLVQELAQPPARPRAQPRLMLPWSAGETWHYTGGPHGGWGAATAWAAVDFAPASAPGCEPSPEWILAAAPGVVAFSENGLVLLDLDGDGDAGTGWVIAYLHVASVERIAVGARVAVGDRLGHASCEGGRASGAHVHFARRYDGEWVPAAGRPSPLILSGWTFEAGAREYDGLMHHPQAGTRAAVAGLTAGRTDLVSDNRPPVVDERDAAGVAAVSGSAAAEAPSGGSLVVKLSLAGRSSHETSFVLGLSRADEPTTVLLGRTGPDGVSEPITLPPLADGVYTVTLRAPGFAAARAL
ncbi:MAG: M23 family metallopeptidase, partial [Anaerolineae bacterium]